MRFAVLGFRIEPVLWYDRVRRLHGLSDDSIDAFVQDIQFASLNVDPPMKLAVVTNDPDDDPIVATAVSAGAAYLCTLDSHIRSKPVAEYCALHGVEVISDVELLSRLRNRAP